MTAGLFGRRLVGRYMRSALGFILLACIFCAYVYYDYTTMKRYFPNMTCIEYVILSHKMHIISDGQK